MSLGRVEQSHSFDKKEENKNIISSLWQNEDYSFCNNIHEKIRRSIYKMSFGKMGPHQNLE